MTADIIRADYQHLDRIAAQFADEEKHIKGLLQVLHFQTNRLRRGGWVADAADEFYRDMDNRVFPSLDKLLYALGKSEATIREIARLMHLAEEEACGVMPTDKSTKGPVVRSDVGVAWFNQQAGDGTGIRFKDFPYHLLEGATLDTYDSRRLGNWSDEEIAKFLKEDPTNPKLSDYVDAKISLLSNRTAAGVAAWEGSVSGDWGNASLKALSLEGSAGYEGSIGTDGLKFKADAEVGAYLAHATANANISGAEVSGEAFLGANMRGEAAATFNPITGEVGFHGGAEAFVGGKAGGEVAIPLSGVGLESTKVGVQGAVSYGLGAKAELNVGEVAPGKYKFDFHTGLTVGLGLEGGFTVEVDANKVAQDITRIGQAVTHFADVLF
ncbi:MAG: WXG100 family type VII secretion target [Anaerolineae bacterium]|nr:WXG100 family type VII secretion target [Anaerolineae bacterium]